MLKFPSLVAVGDSALLVEFENHIDALTNAKVLSLKHLLDDTEITGIIETVASFRSLLIHYNCLVISLADLEAGVGRLLASSEHQVNSGKRWRIPVFYHGHGAVDLDEVARIHGLTTNEVIRLHKESNFQVYMVGFAPGWCYLGGLNPMLHTPRLDSPRLQVPAGCISIGGQQGMIGALPMPSGWRLLGQTPVKSYVPDRDPPFIISAGDLIEFYQINAAEYERMQQAAERGELIAQDITNNQ
ncbi:MAG: KipI family sensor histidine kinase inhibitor [Arenicella sp.]